jgi:NADH:ubiquinone oxidoreductase subunit C
MSPTTFSLANQSRDKVSLERLKNKAEISLAKNRKLQEQFNLVYQTLVQNFKNLKKEKIIKIDIYQNLLFNIDKILKLLIDYKKEELELVKQIKELSNKINLMVEIKIEPSPKKKTTATVYELFKGKDRKRQ